MMLHTHALVGAGIAKHTNKPWLIFALGNATHVLMDVTPHVEWSTFGSTMWHWVTFLDVGFLAMVTIVSPSLARRSIGLSLWAVFSSLLFDLIQPISVLNDRFHNFYGAFLDFLHFGIINTLNFTTNEKLLFQAIITLVALAIIVYPRQKLAR
jgi:hypothetical protein